MSNVTELGHDDVITPLPLTGTAGAKLFTSYDLHPDVVYIDGDHEYESVVMDLRMWLERLSETGALIGDDYGWPGVRRAVNEILADAQNFALETHGNKFTLQRTN
jgi:hypothetical protein